MKTKRTFSRNARNLNRKPDAPIPVTVFFVSCFLAMSGIIALQFYKHSHPEPPRQTSDSTSVKKVSIQHYFNF